MEERRNPAGRQGGLGWSWLVGVVLADTEFFMQVQGRPCAVGLHRSLPHLAAAIAGAALQNMLPTAGMLHAASVLMTCFGLGRRVQVYPTPLQRLSACWNDRPAQGALQRCPIV